MKSQLRDVGGLHERHVRATIDEAWAVRGLLTEEEKGRDLKIKELRGPWGINK